MKSRLQYSRDEQNEIEVESRQIEQRIWNKKKKIENRIGDKRHLENGSWSRKGGIVLTSFYFKLFYIEDVCIKK